MRLNIEGFIKEFASSPRVSGTESEKKALDLLQERVEEIGFSIRREDFSFLSSIPHRLSIDSIQEETGCSANRLNQERLKRKWDDLHSLQIAPIPCFLVD